MTPFEKPLTQVLAVLLARDLEAFAREVGLLPDDASLWKTQPGVTNSCGVLAAHCAGNLQHYVGAVLGSTGYVRDRPGEFGRRSGSRAELAAELRKARDVIRQVLPGVTDAALDQQYPEAVGGAELSTRAMLLHLSAHLGFHLGQADYLRRTMTGENQVAGAVSAKELEAGLAN
jgi:hypothetical protein